MVALGCVIRGDTPHNQNNANEETNGQAQFSLESGVPVSLGVLTAETLEQAVERAGTKMGNKGADDAMAAIEMLNLVRQLSARKSR